MRKYAELVFVPFTVIGHLVPMVEVAKLMVERDDHLSVTFLIMNSPFHPNATQFAKSLISTSSTRIRLIDLPAQEPDPSTPRIQQMRSFVESQIPHAREAVSELVANRNADSGSPRLAGFVLDMFCTPMIDVANEFGVPSYIFFTSGASFLGLMLHLQLLHDERGVDPTELKGSGVAELEIPSLVHPLPARVLPTVMLEKDWFPAFTGYMRRHREAKGIMVNTFLELESYAVESLSRDGVLPPVHPVGPLLNLRSDGQDVRPEEDEKKHREIMNWLDDQPPSSVVFLCFGSMGSFGADQVVEIARALEHSGHRFLWSLRRPPAKSTDRMEFPSDYANAEEVLPEGFLGRTAGIGRVIGWAPQVKVLAHPAVGAFVSHCGWNSTLESLWFGVPIAAWPMYAEQQFNAFQLVVESGLAVEIKMDYRRDGMSSGGPEMVVSAEEIERGIRQVMEPDSELRKKAKEMSQKSRSALMDGGSSSSSLARLLQDVADNMP